MAGNVQDPMPLADETDWRRDRRRAKEGFKDLEYLPRGRSAWNATLAALAYSARRRVASPGDLNVWAMMHCLPASAHYRKLGSDGLVFWHGTSAARAEKIRERGLMHKRGVWAATDPSIAHGYTRGRSRAFQAGSAMVVFLISKNEWENRATREGGNIAQFHENVPRECIEYILFGDRIEFVGDRRAAEPKPWGAARFKRQHGRWLPRSRPPVRFDASQTYDDLDGWLELSIRRILGVLGSAAAIEIFSSLYATVDPTDALEHKQVFAALEKLCAPARRTNTRLRRFTLLDADA